MTYYKTTTIPEGDIREQWWTHPTIITDKPADKVTWQVLVNMLTMLIRNQYEWFDLEEADEMINWEISEESGWNELEIRPPYNHQPNQEPTEQEMKEFAEALLQTAAACWGWRAMLGMPMEKVELEESATEELYLSVEMAGLKPYERALHDD